MSSGSLRKKMGRGDNGLWNKEEEEDCLVN